MLYNSSGQKEEALRLGKSALELIRQPGCEDDAIEMDALTFLESLEPHRLREEPATMQASDIVQTLAAQPVVEQPAKAGLDLAMVKSRLMELVVDNIASGEDLEADEPLGDAGLDSPA